MPPNKSDAPAGDQLVDAPAAPADLVDAPPAPPRVPKVSDMLLITVDPASNNGHDTAPALVTSVDDDGLVHVLVYRETTAPPQLYGDLAVFADRAAVDDLDVKQRPAFACYYA